MSKAYDNETEALITELKQDLKDHNDYLGKHPNDANTYNLKAKVLVKLGKATDDKSYYNQAMDCHNKAVQFSDQKNPAYLVDRSKFYVEMGNTEKAVADMALVSKLPKTSGIIDIYVSNTIRELSHLDSVQNTIKQLAISGKINGELAVALQEHAKVTAGLVVQVGAHSERLDQHGLDIALIKQALSSLLEVTSLLQKGQQVSTGQLTQLDQLMQKVDKQITNHEQVLQAGGVYDRAEIKRDFETIAKSEQEYAYLKTFYWTTINLFEVYRVLSTDLVKGNIDHDETIQGKLLEKGISAGVKKAVSYGVEMTKGVPLIGGFIGMLDSIVDDIYTAIKEHRLENKVNAINRIIESKFNSAEDIEINIAKIALAVTEIRKDDILHPKSAENSKLEAGIKWIKEKVDAIKDKVFPSVELHDKTNEAVQLALQDVVLIMAYLCEHYEDIERNGQTLIEQISGIVHDQRLNEVISTLGTRLESEANSHTVDISASSTTATTAASSSSSSSTVSSSSSLSSTPVNPIDLIEQKIGKIDLEMIHKKAGIGKWTKSFMTQGKEIEEFLDEAYMKKLLGRLPSSEDVEMARMVIFKHICIGMAKNTTADSFGIENLHCAAKFRDAYPEIIQKIAGANPGLFYNWAIAEECLRNINDDALKGKIKQALPNTQVQADTQVAAVAEETDSPPANSSSSSSSSSSHSTTKLYYINEIIYDNPLLNKQGLLEEALKSFTLSQILDLSTNLSKDLIAEAIASDDSSLILAGLQSLINASDDLH